MRATCFRTVNETIEVMQKHVLGAQTCTRKLQFPHQYHHPVLQSVPHAHICHNTVAMARSGPQIARTCPQPASQLGQTHKPQQRGAGSNGVLPPPPMPPPHHLWTAKTAQRGKPGHTRTHKDTQGHNMRKAARSKGVLRTESEAVAS
eukprot:COSAG02_NODE_5925_length_3937_cov_11.918484_1_plen_147_part_00